MIVGRFPGSLRIVVPGTVALLLACVVVMVGVSAAAWAEDVRMIPDTGGHTASIRAMDVTPDGSLLVTGGEDGTLRLWDLIRKRSQAMISMPADDGSHGVILALALGPRGRTVAVGGWMGKDPDDPDTGRVVLFSLPRGEVLMTLKHAPSPVYALDFSPDGRFLAMGSGDGVVRIWDVEQGTLIHSFRGHAGTVTCLAWIDGRRLVSGGEDGRILAWGLDVPGNIGVLEGHTDRVACLAVSPRGKVLVSGGYDKSVREWDLSSMRGVRQLTVQASPVRSLAFNPQGDELLMTTGSTGEGNGRCLVIDRESGRMQTLFLEHAGGVNQGLFVPGTPLAATAGEDRTVYLWDTRRAKAAHRFAGHGHAIASVGFGRQGDGIYWTRERTRSGVWGRDEASSQPLGVVMRFKENGCPELVPAAMPRDAHCGIKEAGSCRMVRRVGADAVSSLLEVYEGESCRIRIQRNYEDEKEHCAASLTPDGTCVVSGGGYGELAMYRVRTAEKVREFKGHTGAVTCLAISPDGTRLVSGSLDQTVRLWNLKTGELLVTVLATDDHEWIAWTPAGYLACSPSGESLLRCVLDRDKEGIPESVPVAAFGEYFYRPDIVGATYILGRGSSALAGNKAARITPTFLKRNRPPKLEILAPADGVSLESGHVLLLVASDTHDKEPVECRVRVNGHGMTPLEGQRFRVGRTTIPLELPRGENTIGLVCAGTSGTRSVSTVRTNVMGNGDTANASKGDLYYLGVGVENLDMFGRMNLSLSSADVNMIGRTLKSFTGKGYDTVHVRLVSDDYGTPPTRANIEKALAWLEGAGAGDTVVLGLVGQGVTTRDGTAVLLPRDAQSDGQDGYRLESVVELGPLLQRMGKLEARPLIICDLAHAGPLDMTRVMRRAREQGVAMLSATQGDQRSFGTYPSIPCSPFAYALFKGLGAGLFADTSRDGRVRIQELGSYVKKEVQGMDGNLMPSLVVPVGYGDFVVVGSGKG